MASFLVPFPRKITFLFGFSTEKYFRNKSLKGLKEKSKLKTITGTSKLKSRVL